MADMSESLTAATQLWVSSSTGLVLLDETVQWFHRGGSPRAHRSRRGGRCTSKRAVVTSDQNLLRATILSVIGRWPPVELLLRHLF